MTLVDDYGHHPRELAAVFAAARGGWPDRRLVVAFQPHRYSRTRDLFDDFAAVLSEVDVLVLTEVYPAGEAPIAGADAKSLARAIRTRGRVDPVVVNAASELAAVLPGVLRDGDLLLMMGAGDIGAAAQSLAANGFPGRRMSAKNPALPAAAHRRRERVRPRRRADGRHQRRARGLARFRPQRARGPCARAASTRTRSTASSTRWSTRWCTAGSTACSTSCTATGRRRDGVLQGLLEALEVPYTGPACSAAR